MTTINIYRLKTQIMDMDRFMSMAEQFRIEGEPVQTDEALAVRDDERVLAFAQPGAKFAGLLFYNDSSQSAGQVPEKAPSERTARAWADEFTKKFDLLPRLSASKEEAERIGLAVNLSSVQPTAITFDGKERHKHSAGTEVKSSIELSGIPVVGPRAKFRFMFKSVEHPLTVHVSAWDDLSLFEEAELVREHDVVTAVKERLASRRDGQADYRLLDVKLAYFANEYTGGPDLLAPSYFVEIESTSRRSDIKESVQGIRQQIQLPAYR